MSEVIPHQNHEQYVEGLLTDGLLPWNTQITLSRLDSSRLTLTQAETYKAMMKQMRGPTIGGFSLKYSGIRRRLWHFGLELGAPDEITAVRSSMKIAMNNLEIVGVNLEDVEFMGLHSASDDKIERATDAIRAAGFYEQVTIGDNMFIASDSMRYAARSIFNGTHEVAEEMAAGIAHIDTPGVELVSPRVAASYLSAIS